MSKRINVILPDETVQVIDRVAERGNRSRFIDEAITHYVSSRGKQNLRERLKQGAIANADRDLAIAQEWFALDEQTWRKGLARKGRK